MKKGPIIAAVLALVGMAAAWPAAEYYAAHRIKAEIERDGLGTVEKVEVGLLGRRIALDDFRSKAAGELSVKRWEATGLSISFVDLIAGRVPLFEFRLGDPVSAAHIDVKDVHFASPDGLLRWTIGSLKLQGLELGSYDVAASGPSRSRVLVARIGEALTIRRFEASDFVQSSANGGEVGIHHLEAERVDHGKIALVAIDDLRLARHVPQDDAFSIAEVKIRDLDLGLGLQRLAQGVWMPGQPLPRAGVASLRLAGFGGSLLANYGVSLDAVALDIATHSEAARRGHLRIDRLILKAGREAESMKLGVLMQPLGLRELAIDFDCTAEEKRNKGQIAISDCNLAVADMADLSLTMDFSGADQAFWHAVDEGDSSAIGKSSIVLTSAALAIADKGMLERVARAVALTTGQLPAATRAKISKDIRSYQPPNILITEDFTKLLDTIAGFVEQGGKLTLKAKPEPPFGIAMLGLLARPGPDLVSVFGLSATVSR